MGSEGFRPVMALLGPVAAAGPKTCDWACRVASWRILAAAWCAGLVGSVVGGLDCGKAGRLAVFDVDRGGEAGGEDHKMYVVINRSAATKTQKLYC